MGFAVGFSAEDQELLAADPVGMAAQSACQLLGVRVRAGRVLLTAAERLSPQLGKITNVASVPRSCAARARLGFRVAFRLIALASAGCRNLLCCFLSDAEPFSRRGAFERGLLGFPRTHARFGTLSRALFAIWLRMNAELMPIGLGKIDRSEERV